MKQKKFDIKSENGLLSIQEQISLQKIDYQLLMGEGPDRGLLIK